MSVVDIPAMISVIANNTITAVKTKYKFDCFYDLGRYEEITQRLMLKGKGVTTEAKRYPLIWLVIPYVATDGVAASETIKSMEIVIATPTNPESTTPERIQTNYRHKMWLIYDELKNQIDRSGFFIDLDFQNAWNWVDQPYWRGKDSNGKNVFDDYIDAIQLVNMHFILSEETCCRFRLIGTNAD